MSRFCPIVNGRVVYLICQDCDDKECEKKSSKQSEKTIRYFGNYGKLKKQYPRRDSSYNQANQVDKMGVGN